MRAEAQGMPVCGRESVVTGQDKGHGGVGTFLSATCVRLGSEKNGYPNTI